MLQSRSDRAPDLGVGPVVTYLHRSPTQPNAITPEALLSGPGTGVQANLDTKLFQLPKLNRIVHRNELELESANLDLDQAQRDVTYNVMSAYYNVLYDQESLRLKKAAETSAREHLKESQQLFQQGKIAKYEVMRAQVHLANSEPQIIRSTRILLQDKETLARLSGLDPMQDFLVSGSLEQPLEKFNYAALRKSAIDSRIDLKKMHISQRIQKDTIKIDGARDPIRLQANGEYVYYSLMQDGTSAPLSTYNVYLELSFPLLGASHAHTRKQAQVQGEIISLQTRDLQTEIATELAQKLAKLEESTKIMDVQRANVKLAQESLRVGELSYQNGKTTSLDVEDSRQNLLQAQTEYIEALHDYAIGALGIKKSAGMPLNSAQGSQ